MKQYCRYCTYMTCGDVNYCSAKEQTYTDKQVCRANKCKDFELNPIDALGINKKGYQPRHLSLNEIKLKPMSLFSEQESEATS